MINLTLDQRGRRLSGAALATILLVFAGVLTPVFNATAQAMEPVQSQPSPSTPVGLRDKSGNRAIGIKFGAGSTPDATDSRKSEATVKIQVNTLGDIAQDFVFSQTNLFSTPAAIRTSVARQPSPREPEALAVSVPGTPVTLTETPPPNARLTGASCADARASSTGNPASFGVLADNTLTVPAAHVVPGADILCVFTHAVVSGVSGLLFNDDGAGGGIANDGIANGAEVGWPAGPVSLTNCAGVTYEQSESDSTGRFVLALPPRLAVGAPVCVQAAPVAGRQPTGASVDSVALGITTPVTVAGTAYRYGRSSLGHRINWVSRGPGAPEGANIQLGSVPAARFVDAGVQAGPAGSRVNHAHELIAGTAATVSFSIPRAVTVPPTPGWAERIFADPGCTGQLQPDAERLFPPTVSRTLKAGGRLCIVLQETIPARAPPGSRNTTSVQATLVFANAASELSESVVLDDITTVVDIPADAGERRDGPLPRVD